MHLPRGTTMRNAKQYKPEWACYVRSKHHTQRPSNVEHSARHFPILIRERSKRCCPLGLLMQGCDGNYREDNKWRYSARPTQHMGDWQSEDITWRPVAHGAQRQNSLAPRPRQSV